MKVSSVFALLLLLATTGNLFASKSREEVMLQIAKALEFQKAQRLASRPQRELTRKAFGAIVYGRFAEAIGAYTKCVELVSVDEKILYLQEIAYMHFAAKRFDEAEVFHRRAIDVAKAKVGTAGRATTLCIEILARHYIHTKRLARAKSLLQGAIERVSGSSKKAAVVRAHLEKLVAALRSHRVGWIRNQERINLPEFVSSQLVLDVETEACARLLLLGERRRRVYKRLLAGKLSRYERLIYRLGAIEIGMTGKDVTGILGEPDTKTTFPPNFGHWHYGVLGSLKLETTRCQMLMASGTIEFDKEGCVKAIRVLPFSYQRGPDVQNIYGAVAYLSVQLDFERMPKLRLGDKGLVGRLVRRATDRKYGLRLVIENRGKRRVNLDISTNGRCAMAFEWFNAKGQVIFRCIVRPYMSLYDPKCEELATGQTADVSLYADGFGTCLFWTLEPGDYYIRALYSQKGKHDLQDLWLTDLSSIVSNFMKFTINEDGQHMFMPVFGEVEWDR